MPIPHRGHWFWEQNGLPDPADLATLRRGIGHPPGADPAIWPYYRCIVPDHPNLRHPPTELVAEHIALTLYALHQQSQPTPMHEHGTQPGRAFHKLRQSARFSADAVDRRVAATATATSLDELVLHLRGLVTQLRTIKQPLDYTALVEDLAAWDSPSRRRLVQLRWGRDYFHWSKTDTDPQTHTPTGATTM